MDVLPNADPRTPPRLLLVGGGHAMLPLVKQAGAWTRRGVEVTLIDAWDTLYYSGMVPEYLGGVYTADQVQIDLRRLCADAGVTFRCAHVDALSLDKYVVTDDGQTVHFDLAAFDIGSVNPHRALADGAVLTKPLHRIEALERFVQSTPAERRGAHYLAVVGGGAAGVEVLLNITARSERERPGALRVTIFEPSDTLLPGFPTGLQRDVARRLAQRGVSIRLGACAERVEDGTVVLRDGSRVEADCVLWATGTSGQSVFRDAGLPVDDRGFLRVADTLQCSEAPWLFAAGDCATLAGYPGLEKVGVHAVKQGPVLRKNIDAALAALEQGRDMGAARLQSFTPYPIAPLILSTGEPDGLWASGRLWLRGGSVLRLKHFVDRRWMGTFSTEWQDLSLLQHFGNEAASDADQNQLVS